MPANPRHSGAVSGKKRILKFAVSGALLTPLGVGVLGCGPQVEKPRAPQVVTNPAPVRSATPTPPVVQPVEDGPVAKTEPGSAAD